MLRIYMFPADPHKTRSLIGLESPIFNGNNRHKTMSLIDFESPTFNGNTNNRFTTTKQ